MGIPSKEDGTSSFIPRKLASPSITKILFLSVIPLLNNPKTVNGQTSVKASSLPSANFLIKGFFKPTLLKISLIAFNNSKRLFSYFNKAIAIF